MSLFTTPRELHQRAQFYQQLSQLTAAGIPIIQAFEMQVRNPPARSFREPVKKIVADLKNGAVVSEAVQHLGSWIPQFDIALIGAGERSGRLDVVFKLLASYYEERAILLRRILSELAYPVFVFHFAIILFPFIAWFGGKMSGMQFIVQVGGFFLLLYAAIGLLIWSMKSQRAHAWRAFVEKILRPIPMLGSARHALALSRLSIALESLITAGMTIIEAWELAALSSGSPAIHRTVQEWKPRLEAGETPAEAVHDAESQFPEVFANLYHSGEISGQLDDALKRLYVYYRDEATHKFQIISQWGPRIVYMGVALLVAVKVVSFYSGYFKQVQELSQ